MGERYVNALAALRERYVSVLFSCRQALRERHGLRECTGLNRYVSAIVPYGHGSEV